MLVVVLDKLRENQVRAETVENCGCLHNADTQRVITGPHGTHDKLAADNDTREALRSAYSSTDDQPSLRYRHTNEQP